MLCQSKVILRCNTIIFSIGGTFVVAGQRSLAKRFQRGCDQASRRTYSTEDNCGSWRSAHRNSANGVAVARLLHSRLWLQRVASPSRGPFYSHFTRVWETRMSHQPTNGYIPTGVWRIRAFTTGFTSSALPTWFRTISAVPFAILRCLSGLHDCVCRVRYGTFPFSKDAAHAQDAEVDEGTRSHHPRAAGQPCLIIFPQPLWCRFERATGVAHISGEEGLLSLLRKTGFPAEQMYGVDRPTSDSQTAR
jgi:hypothetical protein